MRFSQSLSLLHFRTTISKGLSYFSSLSQAYKEYSFHTHTLPKCTSQMENDDGYNCPCHIHFSQGLDGWDVKWNMTPGNKNNVTSTQDVLVPTQDSVMDNCTLFQSFCCSFNSFQFSTYTRSLDKIFYLF